MPLFVADCREALGPYIRLTKELQLTLQALIEISGSGIETGRAQSNCEDQSAGHSSHSSRPEPTAYRSAIAGCDEVTTLRF
jgi:hypothetical protein